MGKRKKKKKVKKEKRKNNCEKRVKRVKKGRHKEGTRRETREKQGEKRSGPENERSSLTSLAAACAMKGCVVGVPFSSVASLVGSVSSSANGYDREASRVHVRGDSLADRASTLSDGVHDVDFPALPDTVGVPSSSVAGLVGSASSSASGYDREASRVHVRGDSLADRAPSLSDGVHDVDFPALLDIPLPDWIRFTTTSRNTNFAPPENDAQDPGPLIALSPSVPANSIDCSSSFCAFDEPLPPTEPQTLGTTDKYIPSVPTYSHRSPHMMPR